MLHFIPTPIGNLEDITLRSLSLLSKATIILCEDTRVSKKLIHLLQDRFDFTPKVKKYISIHTHNEKEIIQKLDKELFLEDIVYLSDAGMPSISDPGCYLVQYCIKNNIKYEVLPGANALTLAYAWSGFCQKEFLFIGFLPHKGKERDKELNKAMFSGYITIIYEAPHRLLKLLEQICNIDEKREIFLLKEATKKYQSYYKGMAFEIFDRLKDENIRGEWVVVLNSDKKIDSSITQKDILELNISKKQKAKLLAKITNKTVKEIYHELM